MLSLFDTHTHLDQDEFAEDRPEVIRRAREAGVERILVVGISAESSEAAVALAQQHPGVFAAVGIHPNYAAQARFGDWQRVLKLLDHPQVVALGETGLDRHWDFTPFELQQEYFHRHLELSRQTGLPVVIHSRDCNQDILQALRQAASSAPLRGVMHSFSSSWDVAQECLQMGLYIGFAGMVTFKRNDALRAVAAQVPADRLLVETDSPYLAPVPKRGKRNEPAYVVHTAQCLAQVRGLELEQLARLTTENALRLFARAE